MELRLLRSLAGALIPTLLGLVVLAAVIGPSDGSPLIGAVIVGACGVASLVAISWIRQFPVRPNDEAAYGKAATIKLAVAEAPTLIGFALAVTLGPWWLGGLAAGFSLVGTAVSWPSAADRERHELLFLV